MEKIRELIKNAVEVLSKNGVIKPSYYLYISKNDKKLIKYLDGRGYKKEIGDTIVYEINRQII
jgi:mannitol/fructose-specific phosphotransferase system IIA component (Ntr-type)